jgi:hypothetical protein
MSAYATLDDLRPVAAAYAVPLPSDAECGRLLELASGDLDRFLGATYDPAGLEPEQAEALRDAACIQASFRVGMGRDSALGVTDDIASLGSVSFTLRPMPRLSPEAAERVSGLGLVARTLTAAPTPEDGAPDP